MNKGIIFLLGFVGGAVAAGVPTFFITKKVVGDRERERADDEIDYIHRKYTEMRRVPLDDVDIDVEVDIEEEEDGEQPLKPDVPIIFDERVDNNAGVKKYHTPVDKKSLENAYKEVVRVTEGEKALKREDENKELPKPVEITEDQYMIENQNYEKVTLDYYILDDTLMMVDPEQSAEEYFKTGRERLIGDIWRWAPDYLKEDSNDGVAYVRSDDMATDFEVIMHNASYKELMGE